MEMSLEQFFNHLVQYPVLGIIVLLVILVTVVAGATDAPVAIATAIATRCMNPTSALILAAVANFLGLFLMSFVSTSVAETMFNMVKFDVGDAHIALLALMASLIASIAWGTFCWFCGIPASKSHSLIAGITGGAIALNGIDGVVFSEWVKVIEGLVFSLFAGFAIGWVLVRLIALLFSRVNRRRGNIVCIWIQNVLAVIKAGLHGSQDGQKFMSIALLGMALAMGKSSGISGSNFPIWLMVLVSVCMALGTLIGGKKIIKSIAMDMVKLEKYQGVSSSLSTAILLLVSSLSGMPVSTSHCNTASIMGVGTAKSPKEVKWSVAIHMVTAWLLTFPCCGLLGYVLANLFILF